MNNSPESKEAGEQLGRFTVGFAQESKPGRDNPHWSRRTIPGCLKEGEYESGPLYIEDFAVVNKVRGIFGVYDGASGTEGHSDRVARVSGMTIERTLIGYGNLETSADREAAMALGHENARAKIEELRYKNEFGMEYGEKGQTAALTVLVTERPDDQVDITYGQIGDGIIYVFDPDGSSFKILTKRQRAGFGVLNNWIGNIASTHTKYMDPVDDIKTETIPKSCRIIICSDGTEDLTDDELLECFSKSNPQEVADALIAVSRKDDDKTAIVVDLRES